MKIFITGASGHIGAAVTDELLAAGHGVIGLARSESSAKALADKGVEVVQGDLDDTDLLREQAVASDGVIHLAFKHELMRTGEYLGAIDADMRAITALADGLRNSDKPFVGTSGSLALAGTGLDPATEDVELPAGPRVDAENFVIGLADSGVRSSVVRLAPTVHSDLDHHGFVPTLIEFARQHGHSAYIGDGANRWPAVHTLDAARLYRLAVESAPGGSRLHGVAESGIAFRDIAEAIGKGLGVSAISVGPDEAEKYLGFLKDFAGFDNPTSSELTQQRLGWRPTGAGLLDDIAAGHYFAAAL
ncbi:SDR family oxidoreductase [Jongsikchunia kroppenstedtii]|uniref:SDR family oxidoreductase n=1 Tax=Jongsikchunia kroppenstedtii TaxID=1121721 RepID=UPI00037E3644|nr:SDR family oxidoreductase [Jongsikchunia kroppenstedtii]